MKLPQLIRSVISLSGINILSQLVPFLLLPIVAEYFSQKDFANYGLCLAIASPLAVIFSLRYENAIVPADNIKESVSLFFLCLFLILLSTILFAILFYFTANIVIGYFNLSPDFKLYWIMIPFVSAAMAYTQVVNFWWVRFLKIRYMNALKIIQSLLFASSMLVLGYLGVKKGLLISDLFSRYLAVILLGIGLFFLLLKRTSLKLSSIKPVANKYKNFPIQNLIPSLLDAISLSIVVWLVAARFDDATGGDFNLARMVIAVPLGVLSVAVGQVLLSGYSKNVHSGVALWNSVRKHFSLLFLLSVIFIVLYYLVGQQLFLVFFGEKWITASSLSIFIIISSCIKLCISPISVSLIAYKDLKLISIWQVISFVSYGLLFFVKFKSIQEMLFVLIIVEVVLYALYFGFIYIGIIKNDSKITT